MQSDLGQVRKRATAIGVLTAFVLIGAAGLLALDVVALMGTETPAAPTPATASAESSWLALIGRTILTASIILALAVIAPLAGALGLFFLLRRYGKQLGPLIHVEYTGTPSVVVGPYTATSLGVSPPAYAGGSPSTAQPLDLGLSFEEERMQKDSLARRMEAGVLQQVFEDNIKLQEKIGQTKDDELGRIDRVLSELTADDACQPAPMSHDSDAEDCVSGDFGSSPAFDAMAVGQARPDLLDAMAEEKTFQEIP
jgi:hypothetical protein